jgi:Zn-dependent protease
METIFSLIILIMSVVLHEVSHGYAAAILGDPTAKFAGRLTLNPLKHLDPIGSFFVPLITSIVGVPFGWAKPVPYNPYNLRGGKWGPAIVGAAGPSANLFLALFFSLILHSSFAQTFLSASIVPILVYAILININLLVFNLLPVAPLDGSKILFSLIPYRYNHIIEFMEKYQLVLVLFVIFFLDILISPFVHILYYLLIQ